MTALAQTFPDTDQPSPHGPLFLLLVAALLIATLNAAFAADPFARTRVSRRPRRDGDVVLILEDEE